MPAQKWEFACVQDDYVHDNGEWKRVHIFYGPNEVQKKLNDSNTLTLFNLLGADGWELVTATTFEAGLFQPNTMVGHNFSYANALRRVYWFKRTVTEGE